MTAELQAAYDSAWRTMIGGARRIANDPEYSQVLPVCLVVKSDATLQVLALVVETGESLTSMRDALAHYLRESRAQAMTITCEATMATSWTLGEACLAYARCAWEPDARLLTALIDRSQAPGQRWQEAAMRVPDDLIAWLDEAWDLARA